MIPETVAIHNITYIRFTGTEMNVIRLTKSRVRKFYKTIRIRYPHLITVSPPCGDTSILVQRLHLVGAYMKSGSKSVGLSLQMVYLLTASSLQSPTPYSHDSFKVRSIRYLKYHHQVHICVCVFIELVYVCVYVYMYMYVVYKKDTASS